MINQLTMYPNAIDPERRERIISNHVNSIKGAKGLRGMKISKDSLMSPGGPSAFAKVLEVYWESLPDFLQWAQNQTQESNEDKEFLLEHGGLLLYYEVEDLLE